MELVKQKLYQTTVLWHPTSAQSKDGQKSKIVCEPKVLLGTDEKSVGMQTIKSIPNEYDTQLEQIEVVVCPF